MTWARRIVLTGGPGAGKTAVLEMVKKTFCAHVAVLPESASILFRGGFPREATEAARCAAQRAIYHVQRELEWLVGKQPGVEVALCDRGTLDGLAYWPREPSEFFDDLGTSEAEELARYDVVIHLEPPAAGHGYHRDAARVESAAEAAAIDARIVATWQNHPRRFSVPSAPHFIDKARRVIEIIELELPADCKPVNGGHAGSTREAQEGDRAPHRRIASARIRS
jgi:predicted ATPase